MLQKLKKNQPRNLKLKSLDNELNEFIIIGRLGRPYGIKGWIHAFAESDQADSLLKYSPIYIDNGAGWKELEIDQKKAHGKSFILHVKGMDTPEEVRRLTSKHVAITKSQLSRLEEDEYYWADLIGLNVVGVDGVQFGQVKELVRTGPHEVLVVEGVSRHLIPFLLDKYVMKVDLAKKEIIVDWDPEF